MPYTSTAIIIPPEILSEQWFSFVHDLVGQMQATYRNVQALDPDFNQKMIAERIGKKPSFVSRCLSGQQNMTIRTIHDLARGMDCRLDVTFTPLRTLKPANRPAPVEEQPSGSWSSATEKS